MRAYLAKRILALVPVLSVVAVVSFLLIHLIPGDPARAFLGELASEESVLRLRRELGLDRPLVVQFLTWTGDLLQGNLGRSFTEHVPVTVAIARRLQPTAVIALLSMTIAVAFAIPMGVAAAVNRNGWIGQFTMFISLLGLSVPSFWLGIMLIFLFSVRLRWFPTLGYQPLSEGILTTIRYVALPSFALGFSQAALVTRMVRSSMLDVLNQDYVRTARAKGLHGRVVIYKHALKNAMIPIITVIGLSFGTVAGGSVIIETVFSLPGVGRLTYDAVIRRDYLLIQGILLLAAVIYVLINLAVDMIYVLVDPRIKYD